MSSFGWGLEMYRGFDCWIESRDGEVTRWGGE